MRDICRSYILYFQVLMIKAEAEALQKKLTDPTLTEIDKLVVDARFKAIKNEYSRLLEEEKKQNE